MKRVCHFIRRYLHFTATFVGNQVGNHTGYTPVVFYRIHIPHPAFPCPNPMPLPPGKGIEKIKTRLLYNCLRQITKKQEQFILNNLPAPNDTILHFHYGTDAGMYHNILKKAKQPKLVSFYGWDYSMFPRKYSGIGKKYLQHRVFPYSDKITAMTGQMKKALVKLGCPEEKILVHYHGIDAQKFFMERDYETPEKINLLISGTMEPKKGHLFLLKAINECVKNGFNAFRLHIISAGSYRKKIFNKIRQMNLCGKVVCHPQYVYGSKEHLDLLKNADIYLQPSITDRKGNMEGIPGTMVEAMASGLPVIATRHAGIPEIIEHEKNGLLVNENDVEALAHNIMFLAKNKTSRQQSGARAQKHTMKNLDIRIKQAELEKIYDSMIS